MRSELAELLEGIEPIPDQVDRCVDQAFNAFPMPPAVLSRWDDYVTCMGRFYSHMERSILGLKPEANCDLQVQFELCLRLLRKKYGASVIQAPFELARTGNEGGILALLRTVAELMSREHAENRIGGAVSPYCSRQSPQGLIDAAREYVRTYGHLLPSELTEGSAGRILASFSKVLKEHPFMMRRFRQVGR